MMHIIKKKLTSFLANFSSFSQLAISSLLSISPHECVAVIARHADNRTGPPLYGVFLSWLDKLDWDTRKSCFFVLFFFCMSAGRRATEKTHYDSNQRWNIRLFKTLLNKIKCHINFTFCKPKISMAKNKIKNHNWYFLHFEVSCQQSYRSLRRTYHLLT